MMKFTNSLMLLVACVTTTAAVEDEKLPLRRLRQQTLHIPDLFEMSSDKNEKNEWDDANSAASSSQNLMNSRRRTVAQQQLSEMDVFARLLQSDSSLSLSMPNAPTPVVPTPMVVPTPKGPVVTPKGPVAPTPKGPVVPPPAPVVPPPAPVNPAPTIVAPTPTAPAPVATSCPVYPVCASLGLTGECCPTTEGIILDCCSGIVPAPATSPVSSPTGPGTVEPAPTTPVAVVAPTPSSKTKDGSMSKAPSSSGSMSQVTSPSSSGSMSKVTSPASSGSMSGSMDSAPTSKSGSMS